MSASRHSLSWTLDEFLAWERAQEERYEFDGTQPVGMVGGSLRHSAVATRLVEALGRRLRPPCTAFRGDVKIHVAGNRIRYPDAAVSCTDPLPESSDTLPDPVAVFEVLSPSTDAFDRSVKAAEYHATPAIQVYILLDQDQPRATILRRAPDGWREEVVSGPDAVLDLPEVAVAGLRLHEAYPPGRA